MYFLAINIAQIHVQPQIPELPYVLFYAQVISLLQSPFNRLVSYYGFKEKGQLRLLCAIMNSQDKNILVGSCSMFDEPGILLGPISQYHPAALAFEQKISRGLGITFAYLPADKAVQNVPNALERAFSVN
jgi:hypothetical protein